MHCLAPVRLFPYLLIPTVLTACKISSDSAENHRSKSSASGASTTEGTPNDATTSARPDGQGITPTGWLVMGAHFESGTLHENQKNEVIDLKSLPYSGCTYMTRFGIDRLYWSFTDTEDDPTRQLKIIIETDKLPATGSYWTFNGTTQDQAISYETFDNNFQKGWSSALVTDNREACTVEVTKSDRIVDDLGSGVDALGIMARVKCTDLPSFDKKTTLSFAATTGCKGLMVEPKSLSISPETFLDKSSGWTWDLQGFMTWKEADSLCRQKGMRLPSLEEGKRHYQVLLASPVGTKVNSWPYDDMKLFWVSADGTVGADQRPTALQLTADADLAGDIFLNPKAKMAAICVRPK